MKRRVPPLPLDEIVRAQNMAAAGASIADIARELGRPAHELLYLVAPEAAPQAQPHVIRGYTDVKEDYR
jgi:hypothetical protein